MKLTIRLFLVILTFCKINPILAQAESSYGFLNLPVSAHANALGGKNISIIDDNVNMINENPALLGAEMDKQLAFNYMKYVASINVGGVTYGNKINTNGAFGVGVQFTDYGKFINTLPDETIIGNFAAKDLALKAFLAYDITSNLRGGITGKFVSSNYEQYTSTALAVDLGLNYYNPDKDLSLSIVAKNLGGQISKFDNISEKLPFDLLVGFSQSFTHAPIRVSITAHNLTSWSNTPYINLNHQADNIQNSKKGFFDNFFRHLVFGVDIIPNKNLYLAFGYNYALKSDFNLDSRSFLTGITGGAGLHVKMFDINFSLAKHHVSGAAFMLGVTMNFSQFQF